MSTWYTRSSRKINTNSFRTRITCPCYEHPLTPHFYIVKLGFTRVYIIFLFLLLNIDRGYSFEPPHWGGSNVYPRSMFWAKIRKISHLFHLKVIIFTTVKYCSILHGHVCVMSQDFFCLFWRQVFFFLQRGLLILSLTNFTFISEETPADDALSDHYDVDFMTATGYTANFFGTDMQHFRVSITFNVAWNTHHANMSV